MRRLSLALAAGVALTGLALGALPGCADEALLGASGEDLGAQYDGSLDGGAADAAPDAAPDAVSDTSAAADPDAAPDTVSDSATDALADAVSDSATDALADTVSDSAAVTDTVSDSAAVTDTVSDSAADALADAVSDSAAVTDTISDAPPDTAPDTPPDATSACTTWTPFYPPGPATGWKHTSTELFTVTQGSPRHRGQDVVALEGAPQVLIGKFTYGVFDKDLKNEDVEVFILNDPPCGDWVSLGVRETSEDGEYGTQYGIEDDGGRIFFTIPPLLQRPVGVYPVRMLVHGDNSMAKFTLYVVKPGTSAVVFDIDGTLTTDDTQLGIEIFKEMFSGNYIPDFYPGGPDVAHAWAARGTLVVYLTGRPDWLRGMTAQTLLDYGLPPGPLHLTDTNTQAFPTSSGVATYKADFLNLLQDSALLAFEAAYGNATTDIEAYANAGIPKADTYIIGKHAGEQGTQALSDYPSHLPTVQALPPAAVPAPQTWGW